jgi:hypothetical protein
MKESFKERLVECERLLQNLQGAEDRQERIRLLIEMRRLIKTIEEDQRNQGT